MWWVLLISLSAFAQDKDIDLDILKKLDDAGPDYQIDHAARDSVKRPTGTTKYLYPNSTVGMEQILASGTALGAIKEGTILIRVQDDAKFAAPKNMNVNYFLLEDERGFKYLSSRGKVRFKVLGEKIINTTEVTNLFEPPDKYTPANENMVVTKYDKKLRILFEPIFYAGLVDGSYMADLFNDERARYGRTSQFGLRSFAKWDWPIFAGLAFSYEKSLYDLKGGGTVVYTSPSLGPMFKTKDFVFFDLAFRLQTQYRVSPFARADVETKNEDLNLKFNSSDFQLSVEHPLKNRFGEFVLGIFFQAQWLNIKDQETAAQIIANNQSNNSYGLSFSQVFE